MQKLEGEQRSTKSFVDEILLPAIQFNFFPAFVVQFCNFGMKHDRTDKKKSNEVY